MQAMEEAIGIQSVFPWQPAGRQATVQQTNTYVMSRVYLLCGGGKAMKITFREGTFRGIIQFWHVGFVRRCFFILNPKLF